MAELNNNLWAPWRMEYIRSLADTGTKDGCFLCDYWDDPEHDETNRVLWRKPATFVVMNRFPYTNGHLLVAHAHHIADFESLEVDTLVEMTTTIRDAVAVLRRTIHPQGFNVGYNIGHCAGAGLPGHLHAHIVPRWPGDTNFMAVLSDVRMIPDALDALWRELKQSADAMRLVNGA